MKNRLNLFHFRLCMSCDSSNHYHIFQLIDLKFVANNCEVHQNKSLIKIKIKLEFNLTLKLVIKITFNIDDAKLFELLT